LLVSDVLSALATALADHNALATKAIAIVLEIDESLS